MSAELRRRIRFVAVVVVAWLTGVGPLPRAFAFQQTNPSAAAPATGPAAPGTGQSMKVIIVEVVGAVQVSMDGKTWKPAKVNMELNEGASFRTGIRSSVTCIIPPDQTFKLESLGTVRVAEAAKQGSKVKTDLIMKYGATSYGIEAAGAEHDATIRTPSSTLAVRGTVVRVEDQPPFAPKAESFTGRALYNTARRETRLGGTKYASVNSVQGSAAETALSQSVVDPNTVRARTASESQFIANQVSLGATSSFDTNAGIAVVRGGAGPHPDEGLAASLPGQLSFVLRWSGNADLNLLVTDQAITPGDITYGKTHLDQIIASQRAGGATNLVVPTDLTDAEYGQLAVVDRRFSPKEVLYPGYGLNVAKSGGTIPFDHRGGPNGGQEIAFWQGTPPVGVFGASLIHIGGAETDFKINAFLNGKPLMMNGGDFEFDANGNPVLDENGIPVIHLTRFRTFRGTVGPGGFDSAVLFSPGNRIFDQRGDDIDPDTNAAVQAIAKRALAAMNDTAASAAKPAGGPNGTSAAALAGPRTAAQEAAAAQANAKPTVAKTAAATGGPRGGRADGGVPFNRGATVRPK